MKLKEKFQRFWTLSKSHKGFTLVELIVVIAILAILAGVAIPVYNGYIKKAQSAADQQLVDAINTAFAAACLETGYPVENLTSANALMPIDANSKKVVVASVRPAEIQEAFAFYYSGNEDAAFDTFTSLMYSTKNRGFVNAGESGSYVVAYGGGYVQISAEAIAALNDSTYLGNLTTGDLMNQVNDVANMASQFSGGGYDNIKNSAAFVNSFASALGITPDQFEAKAKEMAEQSLKNKGLEVTGTAMQAEIDKFTANAMVLYTAQQSTGMSTDEAKALLNGATLESIAANMNSTDVDTNQQGLTQAALAYGMYYAYVNSDGYEGADKGKTDIGILDVSEALKSEEFQNYISSAQGTKDMQGYLSAMQVIGSTASGTDNAGAVENLIMNGFNNEELTGLLSGVFGK